MRIKSVPDCLRFFFLPARCARNLTFGKGILVGGASVFFFFWVFVDGKGILLGVEGGDEGVLLDEEVTHCFFFFFLSKIAYFLGV